MANNVKTKHNKSKKILGNISLFIHTTSSEQFK
jgi:hypothetical protein